MSGAAQAVAVVVAAAQAAHVSGWCGYTPPGALPKHEGCPGCACECHGEAS